MGGDVLEKTLTAPSQGGDLLAWVREQLDVARIATATAGFASGEAFHRGVMECLREVLTGLVPLEAERDALRAKVAEVEALMVHLGGPSPDRGTLAELEAERRWIPVGERLPPLQTNVFVAFSIAAGGGRAISSLETDGDARPDGLWWASDPEEGAGAEFVEVTHWRPLPAGPEVQAAVQWCPDCGPETGTNPECDMCGAGPEVQP